LKTIRLVLPNLPSLHTAVGATLQKTAEVSIQR
jgi:hypothetical protein